MVVGHGPIGPPSDRARDESQGRGTMKNVRTGPSIPHAEYFPQPRDGGAPARLWGVVRNDARELARFWPVVVNMVSQELRVRYHRSVLGFLWTLINPILMMATLTLVFSQMFGGRADWREYAVYLFAGQVPWTMFAACLIDGSLCIVGSEGLIRKIYVPKLVFPLTKVLINLVIFGLSLAALYIVAVLLRAPITPPMVLLPIVALLFAGFALGAAMVLGVANTFYRDTGHLVTVILQAWYFATPIIYGDKGSAEPMAIRSWFNPAYPFIRMFQLIIRFGEWPSAHLMGAASLIAVGSLLVGYVVFKSQENKLVFRL